jgi:aminobenzoyl-glutamate utilization protein B
MHRTFLLSFVALSAAAIPPLGAQPATSPERTAPMLRSLDARAAHYAGVAKQIWGFAEVGFQEERSSALLSGELERAGFNVKRGVAGMPTAFTAEFGSGKPVIAILGEYDALPGLSQDTVPEQRPLVAGAAGHGCGHHLFGAASAAAAITVREWMQTNRVGGTLRFYGTPAEEGGSGKVYMVRDGLFDDVDAVIAWHPGDRNEVTGTSSMANVSGKVRFRGVSAHAAASPEHGRSALDAVEAMDHMVNLLREHVPDGTRIHYVITNGGRAPNVVPDFAEVYYYARHNDVAVLDDVWERIVNAAKGAALGTGTTYTLEITGAVYSLMPNEALAKVQQNALERVGGVNYTAQEKSWATKLQSSLPPSVVPIGSASEVAPLSVGGSMGGSTDVGDISWRVPTVQLSTATWVPGTPAHSWQAVAAGGMSIGAKGMMVAAKTMALTAADLFTNPATITTATKELERRRGPGFVYKTRLADRKPALDYRK